jgi:hypothetical protein
MEGGDKHSKEIGTNSTMRRNIAGKKREKEDSNLNVLLWPSVTAAAYVHA